MNAKPEKKTILSRSRGPTETLEGEPLPHVPLDVLKANSDFFAHVFRLSPVSLSITKLQNGEFLEVSSSLCSFAGYSRDEMIGKTSQDLGLWRDPKDRRKITDSIRRFGRVQGLELGMKNRMGDEFTCLFYAEKLETEAEPCLLISITNISELKTEQAKLRQSEERIRFLADNTGDALYRLRYKGMAYDYWSPGVERLTGYTPQEIETIKFTNIVKKIESVGVGRISRDYIARERQAGRIEEFRADYLITTKQGEERWLGDHSYPWKDQDGRIVGSVGILTDITERKRAEQELETSREMFKTLAEASFEAIIIHSDERLIKANTQFHTMFGYTEEELQGRDAVEMVVAPESLGLAREILAKGSSGPHEITARRKNGEVFPAEVQVKYMEHQGQAIRVAAISDITERKRAEEEQLLRERLQAAIETAGAACHELNQPLQAVLMMTEILSSKLPIGHSVRPQLESILAEAERMSQITHRLNRITAYRTQRYLGGMNILDLEGAAGKCRH